MYGDYFDSDAESDMAEDDAEEEAAAAGGQEGDDYWDGQQMYDTGEGRPGGGLGHSFLLAVKVAVIVQLGSCHSAWPVSSTIESRFVCVA